MYHLDASPTGPVPPHLKTALLGFLAQHLGPIMPARRLDASTPAKAN
jgi:hypothetical protein